MAAESSTTSVKGLVSVWVGAQARSDSNYPADVLSGLSLVRSVDLARSPTRHRPVGRSDLIGACLTQARRCPVRRPAGAVSPKPKPTKG